jgi:GPI mannosyltransferase 3
LFARFFSWLAVLRRPRMVFALLVCATALSRAWVAVADQGMFWPDEIFQSIEQAHRAAFGIGYIPWEFRDGARSWVYPGLLAIVMKLASWLGAHTGISLVLAAKGFMVALATVTTLFSMRIALRLGGRTAALLTGVLVCCFPALVVFGARCMSEMASASLLTVATALVLGGTRRRQQLAGFIAMAAFFVRFQTGVVVLGLFLFLLFNRRFRDAMHYTAGVVVAGVLGGALDWITWGKPFQSVGVYVTFNLLEGKSAQWGTSPASYYLEHAFLSTGWTLAIVGLGFLLAFWRHRTLAIVSLGFVAMHIYVPHKEYRFLMPIVPLVLTLSGLGLGRVLDWLFARFLRGFFQKFSARWHVLRWLLPVPLCAVLGISMVLRLAPMTVEMMGKDAGNPNGKRSVWHYDEGIMRAQWEASRHADLCGFSMVGFVPVYSGGYAYLHRDVPILVGDGPYEQAAANYIAAPVSHTPPNGYGVVGRYLDMNLLRRAGGCMPVPRNTQL